VQPGHIFPLQAVDGGVLMRAGHTEAGCDLAAWLAAALGGDLRDHEGRRHHGPPARSAAVRAEHG
jgi:3,4-dihydroxy-2-butanone 4-phosphate synthase